MLKMNGDMDLKLLVRINKALYEKTVASIKEACAHFGIKDSVSIHVYSSNVNYKETFTSSALKIPQRPIVRLKTK